jgi:glycosyltransferase involved in cell wall biosynthesis
MKSVLHIYKDYYPPVVGGVEKTINLLCEGMKNDYEVRVLIANTSFKTIEEEVNGVPVIKAKSLGRIASAPLCPSFPRLLKKYEADILHFHHPNPTGDVSYLLTSPRGRVVVTYHSDIVRQRWAMAVYGGALRKFLRRADVIMPTSENYMRSSQVLRHFEYKCKVVPLGIPTRAYEKTPEIEQAAKAIREKYGVPIVMFVGRLRYYKGLHFLIQAMPMIDAQLLIAGSGPEEAHIHKYAPLFKVEGRVKLLGELSDAEVIAHLHAADVFCLPSYLRAEAFGLAQIEAMACGVPVVSTALDTGVPFVNQHEVTGLVVPPAAPSKLAEAINLLLSDEDLRRRLGENARARARTEFDSSIMVERVGAIYKSVLQQ